MYSNENNSLFQTILLDTDTSKKNAEALGPRALVELGNTPGVSVAHVQASN
jgi:hypothetical protein